MPTYQYACTSCGAQLEVVQKFSDDPLTECPECTGRLRKVFSAVGVVFKGSGFYRNDSRDSKSKSGSPTSKAESGSSETKSDSGTKTESSGAGSSTTKSDSSSTGSSSSSSSKSEKVA